MTPTNTEALAAELETRYPLSADARQAAAELRRLAAVEAELREANAQFTRRQVWWNDKMVDLEAERDALRADAERYRWLKKEHERYDPICHLSWKKNLDRDGSEWVNTHHLDRAIDAAMKGTQ